MKVNRLVFVFSAILFLSSCTSSVRFSSSGNSSGGTSVQSSGSGNIQYSGSDVFTGKASYYASKFHGRQTASGEIYDENKLSAAHRELKFGTKVKVRNLKNGREVIVVINDRGPFAAGREIDLSYAAAQEIDMIRDGVVDVEVIILE